MWRVWGRLDLMDRVGIGWRSELASAILSNLEHIDVVEVIIDDYFRAPKSELRALATLARQVPVLYHGVGLGLASSHPVEQRRLDNLARVFDYLAPKTWSEHLAFVRAGGFEIGHLAAPPRTLNTIEGALENLRRIKQTVGSYPLLENIATLIDPPGSKMSEQQWTSEIVSKSGCHLLLDLHNLYANAINFGFDPTAYLLSFPLSKVQLVHLSGGRWIKGPLGLQSPLGFVGSRLLDDHVHDVPDEVFNLLGLLAHSVSQPLTVIIERDGEYPDFLVLLNQIKRTRKVLRAAKGNHERTNI